MMRHTLPSWRSNQPEWRRATPSLLAKVKAACNEDTDPGETVVTKDYLKGGSGGTGTLGYWDRTGTSLSPVNDGDSVLIGGNLPSAPNIKLNAVMERRASALRLTASLVRLLLVIRERRQMLI